MKKKLLLVTLFLMCIGVEVNAASAPPVQNEIDYSTCMAFSDTFKTISRSEGSYYYKFCFRAACNGEGEYGLSNMVMNSAYRCQNGNGLPYTENAGDACSVYTGKCEISGARYCEKVLYVDCTRNQDGTPYIDNNTTTTTTTKPTSTTTTTTKRTTTTTRKTSTTTTTKKTTTTIVATDESNTNIKSLKIDGKSIEVTNDVNEYKVKIPYGKLNVSVNVVLESSNSTYEVSGNENMPDDNTTINIKVTSKNGKVRNVVVNVERYLLLSKDCTLSSLKIEGYNLKFKSKVYDYKLKIAKTDKELNISVNPKEEEKTTYEIKGNKNLKHNSKIEVIAIAEDGTKCVYSIKIKTKSSFLKILLVIVLITLIAILAAFITKSSMFRAQGKYKYEEK